MFSIREGSNRGHTLWVPLNLVIKGDAEFALFGRGKHYVSPAAREFQYGSYGTTYKEAGATIIKGLISHECFPKESDNL